MIEYWNGTGGAAWITRQEAQDADIAPLEIEAAHRLYEKHALGARDDAQAMQYLIPGWRFDNKRPCLVR